MKKVLKALLSLALMTTMTACGQKEEDTASEDTQTVEVDEGLINVTITLPASFFELMDTTAEDYVAQQTEDSRFKEIKLNDNGSVDITMSKKDYKEMLSGMAEGIDKSLQDLVDDQENYPNITGIKVNDDYSKFTVTLGSGELSMTDGFTVLLFYYTGGLYQLFAGVEHPRIDVDFVDQDGNVVESANSEAFFNDLDN